MMGSKREKQDRGSMQRTALRSAADAERLGDAKIGPRYIATNSPE